jgi:hypothetical protein
LLTQMSWVRFPELPSCREDNEELLEEKWRLRSRKLRLTTVGGTAAMTTRHPSIHKSWHYISPTNGGLSVGAVRLRTKGHGVRFCFVLSTIYNFLFRIRENNLMTMCPLSAVDAELVIETTLQMELER